MFENVIDNYQTYYNKIYLMSSTNNIYGLNYDYF